VTISAPFTNASGAQVQVSSGTLSLGGGTLGGMYAVSSLATLNISGTESLPTAATFSGAGSVAITGGTTTINGSLAYNNLTLSGGTLAGTGTVSGSTLTLNGGTLNLNFAANGTTANTFSGGTLTVGSGYTFTIPSGNTLQATVGNIAGPGSFNNQGTLTKTGTGTVTITAPFTNVSGAQVLVQAGTLSLGGGALDGNYSISSGATLDLAPGASVLSTAFITGAGRLTTAATVTVAAGGTSDYSGGTTVNSGGNLLVSGAGAALGTGNVVVANSGVLRLSDAANVGASAKVSVSGAAVLGLEASFDPTPNVASTSAGVLAIDATNFTAPLNLASLGGGAMFLGSIGGGTYAATTLGAGASSAYRLGGGGGTLTLSGTNVLTGANSVTVGAVALTGTVRITAANNYSGGTTLAAGTLAVGAAGALGSGPLTITGGTFQADVGPVSVANNVTLGGNVTIGGTSLLTLAGNVTLTGSRTVTVSGTGGMSITGNIGFDVLGRSLTKAGAGTLIVSGTNTYNGGTVINAGTLQSTGVNQALGLGNVTINSGATLRQGSFSNLGGGSSVRVNTGGVLGLDGNFPPSLDPASTGVVAIDNANYSQALTQSTMGNGQLFIGALGTGQYNATTLGAGTGSAYRLGGAGGTLTIPNANVLTGFNSLLVGSTQVNGAGTVVLAAAQDFQGNTTINAGSKLVLNTSLTGPGTIFILPGATLAGSGATGGYVNLGGTVSPGNSPGTLTFTNGVGFGAGSHYTWELSALTTAGPGTTYDQVMVTGGMVTVNPTAGLTLSFIGTATDPSAGDPFWQAVQSWPIVGLTGPATTSGPLAFQINNSAWMSAGTFVTALDPGGAAVDLVWLPASVPEPGTFALAGMAAAGLTCWRRRHRAIFRPGPGPS
jgi:autotransporter-associated beta strand protein